MQSELDAIDLRNRVRQRLNTAIARICRHAPGDITKAAAELRQAADELERGQAEVGRERRLLSALK